MKSALPPNEACFDFKPKKALRTLTCPQLQQHFANLSLPLFLGYVQFSWDLKLQDEERITNTNSILCL